MLSIDEAIELQMKIAGKGSDWWKNCRNTKKHCKDCMADHEQLAEWLEELKAYREIGTVEGYKSAIECYTEEYLLRKSNKQYNKAIDDFKSRLEDRILAGKMLAEKFAYIDNCDIDEIAEQLKAGGKE